MSVSSSPSQSIPLPLFSLAMLVDGADSRPTEVRARVVDAMRHADIVMNRFYEASDRDLALNQPIDLLWDNATRSDAYRCLADMLKTNPRLELPLNWVVTETAREAVFLGLVLAFRMFVEARGGAR